MLFILKEGEMHMKTLLKNKRLMLGIFIPVVFALGLLYLYLPAFNGIEDNIEKINVIIVNDDKGIGTEITNQIETNAPFNLVEETSIDEAMNQLKEKKAHMVIEIPNDFTASIQGGKPVINFTIDEARQPAIDSAMEKAAEEITQLLNENMYKMKKGKITSGIEEFYTKMEDEMSVNKPLQQSKEIVGHSLDSLDYTSINSNIVKINENNNSLNNVLPLLIFLTVFVSALIRTFLYEKEVNLVKVESPSWQILWHKQVLNILSAILYPLAILLIFYSFNIEIATSYSILWAFLSVAFFMFSLFIQVFIDLFSTKGVGFLILLLLVQILTSGIVLPIELVTRYYTWISPFLPATYFTEGIYTVIYSGSSIGNALFVMTVFGMGAFIVSLIYTTIKNKG